MAAILRASFSRLNRVSSRMASSKGSKPSKSVWSFCAVAAWSTLGLAPTSPSTDVVCALAFFGAILVLQVLGRRGGTVSWGAAWWGLVLGPWRVGASSGRALVLRAYSSRMRAAALFRGQRLRLGLGL